MSVVDKIVTSVGLVASLAAAGFWLWGSLIKVPNNIDTIVGELQRIGRLNAWAALAALAKYNWRCLEVIIEVANKQEKITYQELADRLGLKLAKQEWHTVLDPVAWRTKRDLGNDIGRREVLI